MVNIGRQIRRGLRHAVLDVHFICIDIGIDVKGHRQLHGVVIAVGGLHVKHVIHAVHLLFDGSGDRLLHGQGVGAGIVCRDDDLRWNDVRELCLGQGAHRHEAGEHGDDGDDDGNDGAPNKKLSHGLLRPLAFGNRHWVHGGAVTRELHSAHQ